METTPAATARACRVVIADDHAIVRNAVRPLLESIAGVEVVGEADNGIAAIALARSLKPDLLVLDVSMPHAGGMVVIEEVRRWSPETRVAVLTGIGATGTLSQLLDSGAAGVMLKTCEPDELEEGFRTLVSGGSYVARSLRSAVPAGGVVGQLTARERQILSLAAKGRTNADIAGLLSISQKTVDNHRTNLMRKLDVHSIAELVALAAREGLLDDA
jgi:DNA-binding NarL/FixJ family response regulator